MSVCLAALSVWWLTGKVKHVHSDGFFFFFLHSQNVWQAWHDRDRPFRQDKAEEDRDKRKKPSAHQREWVSLESTVCVWTVKPWSLPATISLSVIAHCFQVLTKDYTLSKQSSKKKKKSQIAAASAHHQYTAYPLRIHHTHTPADLNCLLLFFPPPAAIEQERKGDATPWLLSTWRKRSWDATAKSTFFWLSQYFNLLLCLQIRVLLSSLGCRKCSWHPHMGVLLPLWWKKL